MTKLISPENGKLISLHTQVQKDFRKYHHHMGYEGPIHWKHPERSGREEATHPAPVEFSWNTDAHTSRFEISENSDFADSTVYMIDNASIVLDNFKIGTKYYWRVNSGEKFTFTTEDIPPRFIRANGVSNVRDIGGWMTKHGRRMKQGILYRCGKAEDEDSYTGEPTFEVLGIRCEIDLREEVYGLRTKSTFSKYMKYLNLPCDCYGPFFTQKPNCKEIIETIADETNYPLIFHCVGGADRTGTLAFLLEALCGVCEDDLFLDYEITSLSIWNERNHKAEYFSPLIVALRAYGDDHTPWDTLAERFMLDCGISHETIAHIKKNLLE